MTNTINIYQLFPRLFGNKKQEQQFDGNKSKNGCGTFADINIKALDALKTLGITHIWLTGILRHATLTNYAAEGLKANHPDITKGMAGSPFAVTDYFDVDPDLATRPKERMNEFERLVKRMHRKGLKVIIDFIPNHLSREYHSLNQQHEQFGAHDDTSVAFHPMNNFYYCPGQQFQSPRDDNYREFPAKASGNDIFSPCPDINDWYDTVKLNYGLDYRDGSTHFSPIPDTWRKMLEVILFWCGKGVDGFRVDMAEMVPVEFWNWLIAEVRKQYHPLLIAEIYKPKLYRSFLDAGFDFLYDKEGMYNTMESILCQGARADNLSHVWTSLEGIDDKMLRFMENHDEKRLASPYFVGDAFAALPAVIVAALMNRGSFMIYNGEENGEDAIGAKGYSGDDGRTSIFDYTNMPKHQAWMNDGQFDGGKSTERHKKLFSVYSKLLNIRLNHKAISEGAFYDLMWCNPWYSHFDPQYVYAFLRYHEDDRLLVVVNFNRNESRSQQVKIPADALALMKINTDKGQWRAENLINGDHMTIDMTKMTEEGIMVQLDSSEVCVLSLEMR